MTARSFREILLARILPRIEKIEYLARHKQTTAQIVLPSRRKAGIYGVLGHCQAYAGVDAVAFCRKFLTGG